MAGDKTSCLIEDLDEDTEYNFRVAAINKYGTGEFVIFPIAHTAAASEELEEQEEVELEEIPEKLDEEQELIEPERPKVKKAVKKDESKDTEQLEEELKPVDDEKDDDISQAELAKEKKVEVIDFNKDVETAKNVEQLNISKLKKEKVKEMLDGVKKYEKEVKDEVYEMDKKKVKKPDTVESEERKPKKTKRKKESSEETVAMAQQKSVVAAGNLVEDNVDRTFEVGKKTTADYTEHVEEQESADRVSLKKERAVSEEMKSINELDRNKPQEKGEHEEKTAASSIEKKTFKKKLDKKDSQKEKKSAETTTEFEAKKDFKMKRKEEKEIDVSKVSEAVKSVENVNEFILEEESIIKENKEIKKKPSKEKGGKTTVKKAAVDANVDLQLVKHDVIAEEIATSEKMKIEAEEEKIKKDNLEEESVKNKSKIKKKEQRVEQKKKVDEMVNVDRSFKNISNIENVDKIISILENKEVVTSMKAPSMMKKSKTHKELVKEKPEDLAEKRQKKSKAEKLEGKLEIDEKVEKSKPAKEEVEESVSKRLDSEQKIEEQKPVEGSEIKPKKKVPSKKVVKKALQKPSEATKRSVEEDIKQTEDETRDVHMEEKHVREEEVDRFKDGEIEKLDTSSDVGVTVNIPALPISEVMESDGTNGILTLLSKSEKLTPRRRKRLSGFALLPDRQILAFRNDTVRIECEVFNEDEMINWTINGKPATDDIRCAEIVNGYLRILQIKNVVPEDTDMIITANLDEYSAQSRLIIEDIPVEIIERLPRKITGKTGDSIKLSIAVTHSARNCQWFFNNERLIENDDQYEVNVEGNICSLMIKNLVYDQTGRYSVKVDYAETSTILTVEGAPILHEIETIVTTIDVESQDNLTLMVPFKAVPEPALECLFNNEKIPSRAKVQLDISNDRARLLKRKVDKSDAGEYVIKIKNDYGEVSQAFSVNVKG